MCPGLNLGAGDVANVVGSNPTLPSGLDESTTSIWRFLALHRGNRGTLAGTAQTALEQPDAGTINRKLVLVREFANPRIKCAGKTKLSVGNRLDHGRTSPGQWWRVHQCISSI